MRVAAYDGKIGAAICGRATRLWAQVHDAELPGQPPAMDILMWRELVAFAGGRGTAEAWLREGRWWRVVRGAYAPVELLDDAATRARALRLVLPEDAAVSGRTALWLLGIDVAGDDVEVTVPRGRHLRARAGLRVVSAELAHHDLVEVGGRLSVSAARAVVDVARRESMVEAVAVADAVLRAGAATPEQLLDVVDRSRGLRGVSHARAVLPHLEPRSESLMESRLRMRFVLGGVPRPAAQVDVYDDLGHVARVDLLLEDVALEYDGRDVRLDKDVFIRERRRQTRLLETGLELRRFTSADVYVRPAAAVCAEVLRAVELARGRGGSRARTGPDTLRAPRLRPLRTLADTRCADAA